MAISPFQGRETLTVRDVAALLTCHGNPNCSDPGYARGTTVCDEWECVIAEAIDAGKLQPVGGERKEMGGGRWKDERQLRRDDVRRWLQESKGAAEANIPAPFWPVGEVPQASVSRGEDAKKDSAEDEVRTQEAFGLLLETFSHQVSKCRHGDAPNQSQIAEEMLKCVPEGVTKMGKRKLLDQLSAALKAWEAKKRS